MEIKLAIHDRPHSFSDRWIEYCRECNISFQVVDCLRNDVFAQLSGMHGLLWHWAQHGNGDPLAAKAIIRTSEILGIKTFPNLNTCWHFDDKISQKYLLEAIGAPLVPTFVFYDMNEAIEWTAKAQFPLVFKLSKGAGSVNVQLVENVDKARMLIKKAFGTGIKQSGGYFTDTGKKIKQLEKRKDYLGAIQRFPAAFRAARQRQKQYNVERNYVYFQSFVPGNTFDTRITVIGNRAFAFTREVRKDDFRASGSGLIRYELEKINLECVKIAFNVSRRIETQSLAFDFVMDACGDPRIVEISYGFQAEPVRNCSGYWDDNLNWHEGHVWPQDAILEDFLNQLRSV
ncbi:MAG: hypothetical protein JXK94_10375 [Deltaproteobacteria bacterium]|nr:hypothetical protein [Deltaproteobacteria bacterium]